MFTSETQSESQPDVQQFESSAQTMATQGSQLPLSHSAAPAVQTSWHCCGELQVGPVVVVVLVVVEVLVVVVGAWVVVVVVVVVVELVVVVGA